MARPNLPAAMIARCRGLGRRYGATTAAIACAARNSMLIAIAREESSPLPNAATAIVVATSPTARRACGSELRRRMVRLPALVRRCARASDRGRRMVVIDRTIVVRPRPGPVTVVPWGDGPFAVIREWLGGDPSLPAGAPLRRG